MDVKLHEQRVGVVSPHILDRQDNEEVVVGLAPLQEALATLDIFHQERSVVPDTVRRTHIDGCIKLPSGPRYVLRTIRRAVEEHVVYATGEHQVEVRFHL